MRAYRLTHLDDDALLRGLVELVAQDRLTTAALLAHIAEVDARRLYAPAGYPSMHAYCVEELRLSEDAAFKRIQAARVAREFPVLFTALADGRLHLTGLCLLAPHLTAACIDELLAAASHRRKSEIERLLAQRLARAEAPALLRPLATAPLAPAQVGAGGDGAATSCPPLAPAQVDSSPPAAPGPAPRYALHLTLDQGTQDKLRYAQALLSHAVPSGDVAQVLERALDALIGQLEKRKFAATAKPRPPRRATARTRHVPAHVRRAVWERDQGRCTFVSAQGRRCQARQLLEFDHVDPVARGGRATLQRMRLRCRTHNQLEAERAFGAGFIHAKREQARRGARPRQPGGVPVRPNGAKPCVHDRHGSNR